MKKLEGTIAFVNREKGFSIVERRVKDERIGGTYLEKYYLNRLRITFQIPDEIKVGQFVRFEVDESRPRKFSTDLRAAINAEVFETADQLKFYAAATSTAEVK